MSDTSSSTATCSHMPSRILADSYALAAKAQAWYWNVRGPNFSSLHALFEEQYQDAAEAVDRLAERLRALKIRAPGGLGELLSLSSLSEPIRNAAAEAMLADLLESQENLCGLLEQGIGVADAAGDAVSADMLIHRLEALPSRPGCYAAISNDHGRDGRRALRLVAPARWKGRRCGGRQGFNS